MLRYLLALILFLLPTLAKAADSTVTAMTAASALGGTELLYVVQGAADRKGTPAQFATYIYGLASGDCTISSVGAVVCTKTNGVAFGALATITPGTGIATALGVNVGTAGSVVVNGGVLGTPSSGTATNLTGTAAGLTAGNVTTNANLTGMVTSVGNAASLGSFTSANLAAALTNETGTGVAVFGTAPTISSPVIATAAQLSYITGSTQCLTADTSGNVTGTGAVCGGSGASGANPTGTAGPTAVNGVATTFLRSDGAPAVQLATAAQKGIVQVDGTTITAASGVISSVAVTSIATTCGVTGGTITSTGTISGQVVANPQVGANYPIVSGDCGKLVNLSNASNQVPTLPTGASVGSGWFTQVCNQGAGTQTITPTTSTIGGASTFVLSAGSAAAPICVGIVSDGTNYQVAPDFFRFGTNVATAAGTTLSAAGGLTSTIASGTAALGTSAIGSAACATAVTVTATNTATTDVVSASFNGDPTAVTGYIPLTAGMLTIIGYPTSGNVNFKVCNNTSSSITPGAITLNWRVVR